MQEFFRQHPKTKWAGIVVATLILILIAAVSLFDWNLLRPRLARTITADTGREASIDGDLKVHLFSWSPRAEIYGFSLKNPPWADRQPMFGAKRILVSISLLHLLRGQLVLPVVDLEDPTINLERDSEGRASWELGTKTGTPNHNTAPAKIPTIRRLSIENGRLHVLDQIRKLTFSGSLLAVDQEGANDSSAFKVRSLGTLNQKPFKLDIDGGPLINLSPSDPYSFTTRLTASDINLETHITVLKPFDLSELDTSFVVSGNDLADVFYLTGLALPNTPKYRLAAKVHVSGTLYTVDSLQGTLGTSDISGNAHVDAKGEKPTLYAKLESKRLDIVDVAPSLGEGAPKARSLATPTAKPAPPRAKQAAAAQAPAADRLFPDADLQVNRVRGMNADVTYKAQTVVAPKVPMKGVEFHLVLHDGLLTIDPLTFVLNAGKFSGKVKIDARGDVPVTDIDMRLVNVDLAQFKSASMTQAPLQGDLQGRLQFHGAGSSVHKLAGKSDGNLSVVIPHGKIRDAFAELTGINVLKGLGLLITKDQSETDIRCGIIDFKDQKGSLNTTTVYVDTSNVLVTGRGKIDLDDERVDLALQGNPKKVRFLRLRSPIELGGTLLHPTVGLQASKLATQAGVAAVLGVFLTPAAAALAFIDPGLGKDKDCSTVLAQAAAGVKN